MENNKLILIDGNAIIHRAFHAFPPFTTSTGEQVNAVYGFALILLNLLNLQRPSHIAVAFDMKAPTFRHKEYKEYKATRKKAPDGLYPQIPRIKELVKAFKIPIYEMEGYEGDDVLGTLSTQADKLESVHTYIVTGDLDALQLVTDYTSVYALTNRFSQPKIYDAAAVMERLGLTPAQVPDMKGLEGDSSDNIKGVPGVGPKTARPLLQKYGTLEGLYENVDEVTGSTHTKLVEHKDSAIQSKHLATIVTDMPIELDLESCATHEYDEETLRKIFEELEFKSLLAKLDNFHSHSSIKKEEATKPKQESLF